MSSPLAKAKANDIGQPMNIAVVDAGTNLKAFTRMDGAWLGSIDIAINKAFTAKAFDISTQALGPNSQPGDQFYGIHVSNHDRVMIFAGGMPLIVDGKIVGAVGVSGGSGMQDQRWPRRRRLSANKSIIFVSSAAGFSARCSFSRCGDAVSAR